MEKSELKAYLNGLDAGRIDDVGRLAQLLAAEWDSLDGANAGGMEGYKLNKRMESVVWKAPVLSFEVERHGGTCQGSKYGEIQAWEVDVSRGIARIVGSRQRLLEPTAARLDLAPLVEMVANAIATGKAEEFLTWSSPDKVKVQIRKLIPDQGPKQTVESRRKRFRHALTIKLETIWWRASVPNVFLRNET